MWFKGELGIRATISASQGQVFLYGHSTQCDCQLSGGIPQRVIRETNRY